MQGQASPNHIWPGDNAALRTEGEAWLNGDGEAPFAFRSSETQGISN
jgi:hypothetical protein